jgi:hypothetical protein
MPIDPEKRGVRVGRAFEPDGPDSPRKAVRLESLTYARQVSTLEKARQAVDKACRDK